MQYGVDYSAGAGTWSATKIASFVAALAAATPDRVFAWRYLDRSGHYPSNKQLTVAELTALVGAGIKVCIGIEDSTDTALGGASVGTSHAQRAKTQLALLGLPTTTPIYYCVDTDTQDWASLGAYFDAIKAEFGGSIASIGVYGGYQVVKWALNNHKVTYAFQAQAWSTVNPDDMETEYYGTGRVLKWDARSHVRQHGESQTTVTIDGTACSADSCYFDDYGQYPRPSTGTSPTQITKTCIHTCEIDSYHPTDASTATCDVGRWSAVAQTNDSFFDFDALNIPAGATVVSAYFRPTQVAGGYAALANMNISLRDGAWGAFTWNSQPVVSAAPVVPVTLAGTTAGVRTFNITTLIQWMVDNHSTDHILKLSRQPDNTTGSPDAKRFSPTASAHTIEVNYTAQSAVTVALPTTWATQGSVSVSKSIRWSFFDPISRSFVTSWSVRYPAGKSVDVAWDVLGGVAQTLHTTWDLASALYPVVVSMVSTWGLGGPVIKTFPMSWRTDTGRAHSVFHVKFWCRKHTETRFEQEDF